MVVRKPTVPFACHEVGMDLTNQSRPRWKRYLWRAIAVSLIAGTSSLLTRLSIWTHELQRPLPSLIAGIDGAPDQVDRAFQQRLEATYPTGVSEQRLIADLLHEGFQANWNWTGSDR